MVQQMLDKGIVIGHAEQLDRPLDVRERIKGTSA